VTAAQDNDALIPVESARCTAPIPGPIAPARRHIEAESRRYPSNPCALESDHGQAAYDTDNLAVPQDLNALSTDNSVLRISPISHSIDAQRYHDIPEHLPDHSNHHAHKSNHYDVDNELNSAQVPDRAAWLMSCAVARFFASTTPPHSCYKPAGYPPRVWVWIDPRVLICLPMT
jgi:hypothetical protein